MATDEQFLALCALNPDCRLESTAAGDGAVEGFVLRLANVWRD